MQELTSAQKAILKIMDKEIAKMEEELAPYQEKLNQLQQLKQSRRVLLSEKSNTGGGGGNGQLSQEMVIAYLKEYEEVTPDDIAQHYKIPNATVRSHLNRHKGTTYERTPEGFWTYIGEA